MIKNIDFSSLAIKWNINDIQFDGEVYFESARICNSNKSMNNYSNYCKEYNQMRFIENIFYFCKKNEIFCYLLDDNSIFSSRNLTIFYYLSELKSENRNLIESRLNGFKLRNDSYSFENYNFKFFDDFIGKAVYKKYFLSQFWIDMINLY